MLYRRGVRCRGRGTGSARSAVFCWVHVVKHCKQSQCSLPLASTSSNLSSIILRPPAIPLKVQIDGFPPATAPKALLEVIVAHVTALRAPGLSRLDPVGPLRWQWRGIHTQRS